MWTFPKSDLKYRLTLRVVAVSAICLAAASAYFVLDTDRSVRARIDAIADVTAKTLELQQNKISWISNPPNEFPDLRVVAASVMAPGLCIAFRANNGDFVQRLCGGPQNEMSDPPQRLRRPIAGYSIPGAKLCGRCSSAARRSAKPLPRSIRQR